MAQNPNKMKEDSNKEASLLFYMKALGGGKIPSPSKQYKFHPTRKFQFDFAWVDKKVAVECDGGRYQFGGGRHSSPGDYDKLNEAAILGWKVIRFLNEQIDKDPSKCVDTIIRALND